MIENLRKKHLRNCITWAVILWIGAGAIVWFSLQGITCFLTQPVNINELGAEYITEGLRVEGTIVGVLDYYAYTDKDGTATEKQFFIPIGDEEYMGMECSGSIMSAANANMELYWDSLDGKEVNGDDLQEIYVSGTIMPLTGESLSIYNEYVDSLGWTDEETQIFMPYVLKCGCYGNLDIDDLGIRAIGVLVLFIIGLFVLISGMKGNNLKELRRYLKTQGSEEAALHKIEQFYNMGTPVQGMRLGEEYFMVVRGATIYFTPSDNLLWAYLHVVQHRTNFIPTGKTYSLIVRMKDGRQFDIAMKNEAAVNEAIQYMSATLPYLLFGYGKELEKEYNKNRSELIAVVEKRRQDARMSDGQDDGWMV